MRKQRITLQTARLLGVQSIGEEKQQKELTRESM